jgi:hypothetical protein
MPRSWGGIDAIMRGVPVGRKIIFLGFVVSFGPHGKPDGLPNSGKLGVS